jgi:hypothetical protein
VADYATLIRPYGLNISSVSDSLVWGVDVEANERFMDLLRSPVFSGPAIVNAGVSGYDTDREYLPAAVIGVAVAN